MANVYVASWTMSDTALGASGTQTRVDHLLNVALMADTQLKIMGRVGGGAFLRLLVVPEYYFNANGASGALQSRDEKHAIYRHLEDISARVPDLALIAGTVAYSKGTFSKDVYNVCPILKGGRIIKKLYKAHDDGVYQVNGTFRTKSDNGKGVPIVTIDGVTIGLDICMDFNRDRLGSYLTTSGLARPDLHVQISGTNSMGTPSAQAKVGGVYLHCDLGGKGANGATAWRINGHNGAMGAAVTRINPTQTLMPPGGGRLIIFDTPV